MCQCQKATKQNHIACKAKRTFCIMAIWSRTMAALSAGITAFRQEYLDADAANSTDGEWNSVEARLLRYDLLWAMYQGNAYNQAIHSWAKGLQASHGLYKYTRAIYNPAYELAALYETTVWGGWLDENAGDGTVTTSALPIVIPLDNEKEKELRAAISLIWKRSNWKTQRNITTLYGAALGDVAVKVIDDAGRGAVYLQPVHPSKIAEIDIDPFGNVKGYVIQEERADPTKKSGTAIYTEIVERGDGDAVHYELRMNGVPYQWDHVDSDGNPANAWTEDYGFVPMVFVQHNDFGQRFGMAECFPKLSAFFEVDDQGSKLDDQVRKMVDSPWLLAGVKKPDTQQTTDGRSSTANRPQPGKEEVPIIYAKDPAANAQPLVSPLSISDASENIQTILEALEKAYPELALYKARQGDLSGVAIRNIRRDAESKIVTARDSYDGALVRAQMMGVHIGAIKKYEGFGDFDAESFANGELSHSIGQRAVFALDPLDEAELENQRLTNLKLAKDAGYPMLLYLSEQGVGEEMIAAIGNSAEFKAQAALLEMASGMGDS